MKDRPRYGLAAGLSILALLATIALAVIVPGQAGAHWAGFTHERYYCQQVVQYTCAYRVRHTWGFTSTKHQDSYGNPTLGANGRGWDSRQIVFSNLGTGTVRACFDGVYPNCHDQDAYWLYPQLENNSPVNHALSGHGFY